MNEHDLTRQANRREMLRLSGAGVLAGVAGSALVAGKGRAGEVEAAAFAISYASWIHGHSMQIEYPDRIASQRRAGYCFHVEGKPGTSNWFHFAIPTPVIINDVRLRPSVVMLRFSTGSVDAFVQNVHIYDGEAKIVEYNDLALSLDNFMARFLVPTKPLIQWGLGISIGVGFGVESMDHRMQFIAAGCDFVV
jgi:hypothetical protein